MKEMILMRSGLIILLSILLSLTACSRKVVMPNAYASSLQGIKMQPQTQNRMVKTFNRLEVRGRVNVLLHTNCSKSSVRLKGDARDLAQVVFLPSGPSLIISLGSGYPRFGQVTADICTQYLSAFTYKGGGVVKLTKFRSAALALSIDNIGPTRIDGNIFLSSLKAYGSSNIVINGLLARNLKVYTYGQPHIKLTGVMRLCELDVLGDGNLSMYWVKSDYLTLRMRQNSFVQLAGVANVLNAELWGNAKLNASFLRAKRVFVKTHDRAIAQITALKRQHTKATDSSDIYFYKIPEMRTDFMAYNGAVLDMREMDAYQRADYDRYNK